MHKPFFIILLLIISNYSCSVCAESSKLTLKPIKGPVFTDYGPVFKVEDRDIELVKDFKYKVFFDVSQSAQDNSKLNRNLESIARFINMHAINGVKLQNMQIAVVLHGSATRDAFNQQSYQQRYEHNNSSLDLIEKLSQKGVMFYLCGQSMNFYNARKSDLAPQINLALSAMTISTMLQADGFSLIP